MVYEVVDNSIELKDIMKGVEFAFEAFMDSNFRKLYRILNFVARSQVGFEENSNILAKEAAKNYFMPLL